MSRDFWLLKLASEFPCGHKSLGIGDYITKIIQKPLYMSYGADSEKSNFYSYQIM